MYREEDVDKTERGMDVHAVAVCVFYCPQGTTVAAVCVVVVSIEWSAKPASSQSGCH